jgi:hypothetical protein
MSLLTEYFIDPYSTGIVDLDITIQKRSGWIYEILICIRSKKGIDYFKNVYTN